MMSYLRAALAVLSILLASTVLASDRLVVVESGVWGDLKDAASAVEAYGGHAKIVIPPHFIIADLPDGAEADLIAASPISTVYSTDVNPDDLAAYGVGARQVAAAWNNVFMGRAAAMGLDNPPSPTASPLINDMDIVNKDVLPLKPPGAKYYDVSEFMLGSCLLAVVLVESDGSIDANTEDWTQAEMDDVTSEIIGGLNWIASKKEWREISFVTVFSYQVPTGYEPITRSSSEESLWISQCLTALGYAGYPGYQYVTALRDSAGTDWATVAFVVDSSNDTDGQFTDGRFAYSSFGGPKFVMTYDNDGWGIANMDCVIAHEYCHNFYALDEYYDAGYGCTAKCGYLNVENQNSEYPNGAGGCATNVRYCIMRSVTLSTARICNYTKGQIAWYDTDSDSIPDVLDTFPETTLDAHAPDPDTVQVVTYTGAASVTKLDNLNPYGKGNDITLNRVAKVEWRVDGTAWQDAVPTDGAWDEGSEAYYFVSGSLLDGPHVFEARAWHTYGNIDSTAAFDSLTIDSTSGVVGPNVRVTMSLDAQPNPFGPRVEIVFTIPGEPGKAVPASVRVFDVKGRQVATLINEARAAGPGRIAWDGTQSSGHAAPSGIYFVELIAGDSRAVSKVVLAR
jgi:hypothetical protein